MVRKIIYFPTAAKEENQKVRVCAEHLRKYNEGLQLSNTIRMCDAFRFLDKYQEAEMKRKFDPDVEEPIQITDTERFLFNLFKGTVMWPLIAIFISLMLVINYITNKILPKEYQQYGSVVLNCTFINKWTHRL